MRRLVIKLIQFYQHSLSPDHSWMRRFRNHGHCRYYPSCSEYTLQAVISFGTGRGLWMGFRRVLRCHPWQAGGFDPLPNRP